MPSRILVTGFAPFGPHAVNPSETAVRRLAASPPEGLRITTLVLPVEYARAFGPVRDVLDRGEVDVVLHVGLAAARDVPAFERFAVNWRGGTMPDQAGTRLDGEPIDPAGPAAYLATVPVDGLVDACRAAGVPAEGSSHAGTFLCNQVLYQTLRYADVRGLAVRAGFLHLPGVPGTQEARGGGAAEAHDERIDRAVASAVGLLARLARPRRPRNVAPPGTRATSPRFVRPTRR